MDNLWTLNNLVENTRGVLLSEAPSAGGLTFKGINSDSRQIQAGECYIAIKGEQFDGHRFIEQAFEKGAVAALVSQMDTSKSLEQPLILVEDTRLALGQFAAWHRQQMPVQSLIAITGSNGKTTTKTLLKTLLQRQGQTLATQGNLNNDLGVPRTLLNLTPQDEYAVIEMGANHEGEIEYLTQLTQPNIAIITNASGAHLEGFGDLEGVIRTKGEILKGLDSNGTAILNQDSEGFEYWKNICDQLQIKIFTFGQTLLADLSVQNMVTQSDGIAFELHEKATKTLYPAHLKVFGQHNALNTAAALSACLVAGFKMAQILPGLEDFTGVKGRFKTYQLRQGLLIDDAYNANPASMKAGMETLVSLAGTPVLVLGGMAELGIVSEMAHQELARYVKDLGIQHVYLYGTLAKPMQPILGESAKWFESHEGLNKTLQTDLETIQQPNIFVKGSRSAGMEAVVQFLLGVNAC